MKSSIASFAAIALLASSAPVSAEQPSPAGLPTGMCINLGNHLETGGESPPDGRKLDKSDFTAIKAAGFETVRMPVNWSKHIGKDAPPRDRSRVVGAGGEAGR